MTGLKSGAGDDLWGEESDEVESEPTLSADEGSSGETSEDAVEDRAEQEQSRSTPTESTSDSQPYIVRRAIQDKSVQFEREERLTFFVHDDVAEGERELLTDLESALGRNVPKFDVREAVYRAALRNQEDVLEELLRMGYSLDEE